MTTTATIRTDAAKAQSPRLVRLKPAATYLSLSQWTLRRLIQEGQIPIVKTHDNAPWLVDIKDLDSWVERSKTSP